MNMVTLFQKYLLPGLVFQSVVIGGGYATGRELVEFFMSIGPGAGLLGMVVATVIWSLVLMASFALVQITRSFDYRSFFKVLLGRGWVLYEISYFLLLILVLSIISAASGTIIGEALGIDNLYGSGLLMVCIGLLVFYGSKTIETVLSLWSFVLYGVFITLLVVTFSNFNPQISGVLNSMNSDGPWFNAGLTYASYNVAAVPAVFFCLIHLKDKKQALIAGAVAGPVAMLPGFFLFFAMLAFYPEITEQSVPLNYLLSQLNFPLLQIVFQVVIFGTFIETGAAFLHAINERVSEVYEEKERSMPRYLRPLLAISFLLLAVVTGSVFGISALIAQGYGILTYSFILILVIPVMTIGVWKIFFSKAQA